jgi:hypothetical protein
MERDKPVLLCSEPFEGQPTRNIGEGKCALCHTPIIYNVPGVATLTKKHGELPMFVCQECFKVILKEEKCIWGGGTIGSEIETDAEKFIERSRTLRLADGGSK